MNIGMKTLFLAYAVGGHFEYGEDYYDGWTADGAHIVSKRKTGAGNWENQPGWVPDENVDEGEIFGQVGFEKHQAEQADKKAAKKAEKEAEKAAKKGDKK